MLFNKAVGMLLYISTCFVHCTKTTVVFSSLSRGWVSHMCIFFHHFLSYCLWVCWNRCLIDAISCYGILITISWHTQTEESALGCKISNPGQHARSQTQSHTVAQFHMSMSVCYLVLWGIVGRKQEEGTHRDKWNYRGSDCPQTQAYSSSSIHSISSCCSNTWPYFLHYSWW